MSGEQSGIGGERAEEGRPGRGATEAAETRGGGTTTERTAAPPRPEASGPDPTGPDPTGPNPTGPNPTGPNPTGPNPTGPNPTRPDAAEASNTGPGRVARADDAARVDLGSTEAAPAVSAPRGRGSADAEPAGGALTGTALATEAPPAEPPDPFAAFAPEPPRAPGRLRRVGGTVGRVLVHEWVLAGLGSVLLAVLMTWPTLRYPKHTIPQDIWDPTLQAWMMAWSGHILTTDPGQLWHANAFFPDRYSFAFSVPLLGYAPAGMIGDGPVAAVVRYNIIFVLAYALAFFGAYVLVRQLGAGRTGAAVAGAAFAYAPWRLAQGGHLHVLSSGGIVLALAMLARGHGWSLRHGYRPERRNAGWALAGWLVAAWQISLGFGIGLPFAYLLAAIVLVVMVAVAVRRVLFRGRRRPFGGRLMFADVIGGTIFGMVGVLLSLPYFRVAELHPYARRTVEEVELYSPPLGAFLVAPGESRIWGDLHAEARSALPWHPEMTLLPGFVLYGLALAGLFLSIWTVRQRLFLLLGVIATIALGMGTRFMGGRLTYLPLYDYLPGWDGLRTPGRLVLWTTLLLGILAAGAVSAFVERVRETRLDPGSGFGFWLRLATLLPLILVLAEGLNRTPHPVVPAAPEALRVAQSPVLVLPSDPLIDNNVMLWSTDGFPQIVNGNSGFPTQRLADVRQATQSFPDLPSIDYLRELGVKTVIVLRTQSADTPWQAAADAPVEGLGIEREERGDAVIFRLSG